MVRALRAQDDWLDWNVESGLMLIRAKAPLRISFAGGGTDVPPFPQREGGAVLSATIDRYAWGSLHPRHDSAISIHSLDFDTSLSYSSKRDIDTEGEMGLVKAMLRKLGGVDDQGLDLYLHTDAPPGSGLGSSSAMMVVLVGLLRDWKGLALTDYQVAEVAHEVERVDMGIAGGRQDHYAATFGGVNYIEFEADRVVVNGLRLGYDILNELEYNLLLVDTGKVRLSANIIEHQVSRYEAGEADSVAALRALKHLAGEMKACLLRREWDCFGRLLHEEWEYKKRMSDRISNPDLDALYDLARERGAIGGKVTGAGGGGYMLLFCRFDRKNAVAEAMRARGCDARGVAFQRRGLQTWRVE
jgi:D-glycero-alpha-D-manno-heptose-7-phosphate kinase